jgi:lipoprotein signal peptidase
VEDQGIFLVLFLVIFKGLISRSCSLPVLGSGGLGNVEDHSIRELGAIVIVDRTTGCINHCIHVCPACVAVPSV